MNALKDNLQQLCSILSLSGYEDGVIRFITDKLKDYPFEVDVDPLGNVIVQLNQRKDSRRIVLFAHMDELGLVVTNILDNGFIKVERLGGIPEKSLAGTEVLIEVENQSWRGIVGTTSHHVTPQEQKMKVKPVTEIFLDFGFDSKEQVLSAGIHPGTPIGYARKFFTNETRVFSNALDNRAGCAALLQLIEEVPIDELQWEVFIVFSVQEEFNLRGVLPAIRKIKPDLGITLDIAIAADTPDLQGKNDIQLRNGPCIGYYTFHGRGTLGGVIPNPKYVKFIEQLAIDNDINLQKYATMGILTDASFSQLENNGFPIVDIGFPIRYSHAPIESIDLVDLQQLVSLLVIILKSLNAEVNFSRG